MDFKNLSRREFVKSSLSTLAVASLPNLALSQTGTETRLEWQQFKTGSHYTSFVEAIRLMRANTNSSDRNSWNYWVNGHGTYCPHQVAYFTAWHRGYLYYFQETLRTVSGNSSLIVPYWDYYKNPNIPAEFTDPSSPLYVTGRVNTNVRSGLGLGLSSTRYKNFPRGMVDAVEPVWEVTPHGKVHNLIGGYMAKLTSPMDPIFWLHHGQMDRLWAAWVAAGGGRQMPPLSDTYWGGSFTYGPNLTMERSRVYNTTGLGYTYDNLALPTTLPPTAQAARIMRVQFVPGQNGRGRPPLGNFTPTGPRDIGNGRRSIGGKRQVTLNENSVSAQIPVAPPDVQSLDAILDRIQSPPVGRGQPPSDTYNSVQIVVDNPQVTRAGANGGYFYEVYLNLPEGGGGDDRYLLGGFGPFEIDAAHHHGGRLVFPATQVLAGLKPSDLSNLTVSFVRISGNNSPRGNVIVLGELRAELSSDPIE